MLMFIKENLATICVALVIVCVAGFIIRYMYQSKKKHPNSCGSCGGGCGACSNSFICHKND